MLFGISCVLPLVFPLVLPSPFYSPTLLFWGGKKEARKTYVGFSFLARKVDPEAQLQVLLRFL